MTEATPTAATHDPKCGVRAFAPVFVSYRTSDGRDLATKLAWALRSTGVPVWHDVTDLPPGDTTRRLEEALGSGLSGAVLLISPDIRHSSVVREIEVPALLRLEDDPAFTLAIGSVIPSARSSATGAVSHGGLDYAAPDALLGQPAGTLQRFKHYSVFDDAGIAALAREMAAQRISAVRALGHEELMLDIQTRVDPRGTPPEVPLTVRIKPPAPGQRLPDREIWSPYAAFLADLPRLLGIANVRRFRIRGAAHLSVAFALGAAVPTTSSWPVAVQDQAGGIWGEPGDGTGRRRVTLREDQGEDDAEGTRGAPVAVYVDLVPAQPPGDTFAEHVTSNPIRYSRTMRLEQVRREPVRPEASKVLVADLAQRIRNFASQASTHRVHLFLRVPFPVAVLLGRTLNTLEITLYEWDDTTTIPRYVEVVTVASGRGGGPILQR